jgi:hypothetical protein
VALIVGHYVSRAFTNLDFNFIKYGFRAYELTACGWVLTPYDSGSSVILDGYFLL